MDALFIAVTAVATAITSVMAVKLTRLTLHQPTYPITGQWVHYPGFPEPLYCKKHGTSSPAVEFSFILTDGETNIPVFRSEWDRRARILSADAVRRLHLPPDAEPARLSLVEND